MEEVPELDGRWTPELLHVLVSPSKVVKQVRGQMRTDVHVLVGPGGTGPTKSHAAWKVGTSWRGIKKLTCHVVKFAYHIAVQYVLASEFVCK